LDTENKKMALKKAFFANDFFNKKSLPKKNKKIKTFFPNDFGVITVSKILFPNGLQ
jgi:hypothetical protein